MLPIEKVSDVWARANVARAQIDVIVQQADRIVQRRVERNQATVGRCLADLRMLAEVIREIPMDGEIEDSAPASFVLASYQAFQPVLEAVKIFEPLVERFLNEHGDLLSTADQKSIAGFIKWVESLQPRLHSLRMSHLDSLEAGLVRAGNEPVDDAWDVTVADGLTDADAA